MHCLSGSHRKLYSLCQVIPRVRLADVRSEGAFCLVRLVLPTKVEVVVALRVLGKLWVVLNRRDVNRRTALPAPEQTRAEQLTALLFRDRGEIERIVGEELVELGYLLIQMAVCEEGTVLCPWWALHRVALRVDVSGFAADEHARRNDNLTWEWGREGRDGRRGNTILEAL